MYKLRRFALVFLFTGGVLRGRSGSSPRPRRPEELESWAGASYVFCAVRTDIASYSTPLKARID
jgi:hypothetical protein